MPEAACNPADVAIVGYYGRFPGAEDPAQFWRNVRDGVHSIRHLSADELRTHGVPDAELSHPNYVSAVAGLSFVEGFDAALFGIPPREAETMDPQHRLFLEVCWAALEHAGYDPCGFRDRVGVFAGARTDTYLLSLVRYEEIVESIGAFHLGLGNDAGFMTTRLSHLLNLTGPSCAVQTACSTSLVAVHLAIRSLLADECDVALAGGVAVNVPHVAGYVAEPGSVLSPDGYCRVFDAAARGTVFGSGVGVAVLKRLEDARADRDCVHAVIKGSAINNDGAVKASFTAPSVRGQAQVVEDALRRADTAADTIGYVEAHGTGTLLGDAIEVRALTKAYRKQTQRRQFCALGSVKSNVGHLDAAAGIAGLIKVVESLKHASIPPSLHYRQSNPQIAFDDSPFYVNTTLRPWPDTGGRRRGAVSAFGVGGTNAHVILEEAPAPEPSGASRPWQLLVWSGRTDEAATTVARELAACLRAEDAPPLPDVAYTLQAGRKRMPWRRAVVCRTSDEAVAALDAGLADAREDDHDVTESGVVFVFPGEGAQRPGMGHELYQHERVYREQIDRCAEAMAGELEVDLRTALYGGGATGLDETWIAQPALFASEYALAALLASWGIRPAAMVGHSVGEYVAACRSGVLTLEDAARLVALRGRLLQEMVPGAMLAVEAGADRLDPLPAGVWVAAEDAGDACTVGGEREAIDRFEACLRSAARTTHRLRTSHACHTPMMEPAIERYVAAMREVRRAPAAVPFVSTVTGTWITDAQAQDAVHWGEQLRAPVQFARAVDSLARDGHRLLLEVGPGHGLSRLIGRLGDLRACPTMASGEQSDLQALLKAVALLWTAGVNVDWAGFSASERRHRVPLPAYPFQRKRYWIDPPARAGRKVSPATAPSRVPKNGNPLEWFWAPSWKLLPSVSLPRHRRSNERWLVFADRHGVGSGLAAGLRAAGADVVCVSAGAAFGRAGSDSFTIEPDNPADYQRLAETLALEDRRAGAILHTWGVGPPESAPDTRAFFDEFQPAGFHSLLHIARELTEHAGSAAAALWVVSSDSQQIESVDAAHPAKAPAAAFCRILSQETDVRARFIDVAFRDFVAHPDATVDRLMTELDRETMQVIAYRGRHRWQVDYERIQIPVHEPAPFPLRDRGVYVLTGGMGAVGQLLGRYLAESCHARLVLTGRTPVPPRERWPELVASAPDGDLARKIAAVEEIEAAGGEVRLVTADVADLAGMKAVFDRCDAEFGGIDGIIHAAGVTSGFSLFRTVRETTVDHCRAQALPKAAGLYVIEQALCGRAPDFVLAMSSNAAVLGGLGFLSYAAANAVMDAFAASRSARDGGTRWLTVNWDHWPEETRKYLDVSTSMDEYAMTRDEARTATEMALTRCERGQIVVATGDLERRLAVWVESHPDGDGPAGSSRGTSELNPRPRLATVFVAPRTPAEEIIAGIWGEFLGVAPVGVHDDFFELGGHSLMAVKMMTEVGRALHIELPLRLLFEGPTVEQLALACGQPLEDPVARESARAASPTA